MLFFLDCREDWVSLGHRWGQGDNWARWQETIRARSESSFLFFLPLSITLILFSFIVLSVFSWFITLQPHSSSSEGSSVKLGHLLTHLSVSVLYPLSSFSCCCPVWFVSPPRSADLQCRSSTWEGSWQRRGQGQLRRENRRWAKQNRVALHKDGAICQPKRVRFEKNRAVIQSKLAEKWVVHDWCAAFFFLRLFFNWVFFFFFFFAIHSGSLQRNREVVRKGKYWLSSGKIWRQGKQARYTCY